MESMGWFFFFFLVEHVKSSIFQITIIYFSWFDLIFAEEIERNW